VFFLGVLTLEGFAVSCRTRLLPLIFESQNSKTRGGKGHMEWLALKWNGHTLRVAEDTFQPTVANIVDCFYPLHVAGPRWATVRDSLFDWQSLGSYVPLGLIGCLLHTWYSAWRIPAPKFATGQVTKFQFRCGEGHLLKKFTLKSEFHHSGTWLFLCERS